MWNIHQNFIFTLSYTIFATCPFNFYLVIRCSIGNCPNKPVVTDPGLNEPPGVNLDMISGFVVIFSSFQIIVSTMILIWIV